jgi:endo-1,4-beta-mannosidase
MDRRAFLRVSAAGAGSLAMTHALAETRSLTPLDLQRHRFGVNYTPSRNWWFCWNDWDADSVKRDLDAIAGLGADHLRILLVWPYFQPNPTYVSALHLDRLDQMLAMMGERRMDALVTVFTGQLSGWYFLPPFQKERDTRAGEAFYSDAALFAAEERFVRELARMMARHANIIGFDLGNEVNTCWSAPAAMGDAWMAKMLALMQRELPGSLNVNGVDHHPWFDGQTFSPRALATQRFPVMHCYPLWTGALNYGGPMDAPSVKLLASMAALIRSYAGRQRTPVWAGEFNTCIDSLDESGQAQWLERAVDAAIAEGVAWFTYWDSHDVDRKFTFNPVEYSLGLLTNDGRVKEQGRTFQKLAAQYRGKPVVYPTTPILPPPTEISVEGTWQWMLKRLRTQA